jgi:hypothetical protein
MPQPPYATLRVARNGGAPATGAITGAYNDSIQLSMDPAGQSGVYAQRWEIYEYPAGFTVPAGWTEDPSTHVYYSTAITPPAFTLPAATYWGKYFFRLTINNGDPGVSGLPKAQFVDESTALKIPSATGIQDVGYLEQRQFDSQRSWVSALKGMLRAMDALGVIATIVAAPANPADDTKMLRASAGAWVMTSTVKSNGTWISTGADPSGSGALRLSAGDTVGIKLSNGTSVQALGQTSSALVYGVNDASLTSMRHIVGTGGSFTFEVAAGVEYTASATTFRGFQNSLSDWGFIELGGTGANVPSSGLIRVGHGVDVIEGLNNTLGSQTALMSWGLSNNRLDFGSFNIVAGMQFDIATGGAWTYKVNSANALQVAAAYVAVGSAPASAGTLRFGADFVVVSKNAAAANANILEFNFAGDDRLYIGSNNVANYQFDVATGGSYVFKINSTSELTLNATTLDITNNNLLTTGEVRFDGTAATGGKLDFANNTTIAVGRTSGGANANLFYWDVSNQILVGSTGVANLYLDVATGGSLTFRVNAVSNHTFTSSGMFIAATAERIEWNAATNNPIIRIDPATAATDNTNRLLEIRGQDKSGNTSTTGSNVLVRAGYATGAGGTHLGGTLTLTAGDASGGSGTRTGGDLIMRAGLGATQDGSWQVTSNTTITLEVARVSNARRVVSLVRGAAITATQMPTNTGDLVVYIGNAATNPSANPVSGVIVYADAGALKARGTSGTVTTVAPAEPHCPRCGSDFVFEAKNPSYAGRMGISRSGHFAACIPCMSKALEKAGIGRDAWAVDEATKEAA